MLVLKSVYDIHPNILGVRVRLTGVQGLRLCMCMSVPRSDQIWQASKGACTHITTQDKILRNDRSLPPLLTYQLSLQRGVGKREWERRRKGDFRSAPRFEYSTVNRTRNSLKKVLDSESVKWSPYLSPYFCPCHTFAGL